MLQLKDVLSVNTDVHFLPSKAKNEQGSIFEEQHVLLMCQSQYK